MCQRPILGPSSPDSVVAVFETTLENEVYWVFLSEPKK